MVESVDDSPLVPKRRKLTTIAFYTMGAQLAKAKLEAANRKYGRDLRVFDSWPPASSPSQLPHDEETDDFYEFTAEDYYRLSATRKEDKYLKTRKIREAEELARRSRITKAVIRVRFPDNHTLEVAFHPSEKIQSLFDLLVKVVARPDLPFYLYTTPPKKHIKDLLQDFYSAGFVPGAILYFSYDLPQGDYAAAVSAGPFLQEEIISLKNLDANSILAEPIQTAPESETVPAALSPVHQDSRPAKKKPIKPKWLKL